eukprot:2935829-Amphidinium_carterae.1
MRKTTTTSSRYITANLKIATTASLAQPLKHKNQLQRFQSARSILQVANMMTKFQTANDS